MGGLSIWHWLVVLAVILLLFGGGSKISGVMGDFAKGIKSFKRNMADDDSAEAHLDSRPGAIPQAGALPASNHTTASRPEPVPHDR